MAASIRRRRISTYLFLFLPGLALASWATRTPAIRDQLGASTAEMGLLLFGVSVGSMTGILSSTPLVRRFGTRPVIATGISLMLLGTALIGAGAGLTLSPLVFFGFMFFGIGLGSAEVGINLEGADIERLIRKPVMVELHGFFSAGTLVGAVLGIALTALEFPVAWHLLAIVAISAPALRWAVRGIEPGFGRSLRQAVGAPADIVAGLSDPEGKRKPDERVLTEGKTGQSESAEVDSGGPGESGPVWKDIRLILIATILLAMALAEGSANDWLPLLMVDGYDLDEASGSLIFAGFAAAMTIGRFGGRRLLEIYGRVAVLRGGAILSVIGLAVVIFADSPVLAGISVLLWGVGVSLGFPVTIAAASDSGPDPVARVSLVVTAGYMAFLVGPPLLGFLGQHFGLRSAMLVVLALLLLATVLSPAVATADRRGG